MDIILSTAENNLKLVSFCGLINITTNSSLKRLGLDGADLYLAQAADPRSSGFCVQCAVMYSEVLFCKHPDLGGGILI